MAAASTRNWCGAASGGRRQTGRRRRSSDASGRWGWNAGAGGRRRSHDVAGGRGRDARAGGSGWRNSRCGGRSRRRGRRVNGRARSSVHGHHDGRPRRLGGEQVDLVRPKRIGRQIAARRRVGQWRWRRGFYSRRSRRWAGRSSRWAGRDNGCGRTGRGDLHGHHAGREGAHVVSTLGGGQLGQALQLRRRDGVAGTSTASQRQQQRKRRETLCPERLRGHADLGLSSPGPSAGQDLCPQERQLPGVFRPDRPDSRPDSHQSVTLGHTTVSIRSGNRPR